MASNGYLRRCCSKCLFYYHCHDGHFCRFNSPSVLMLHISAFEYDRFRKLRFSYDEPCLHFIDREKTFDMIRAHFSEFLKK